MTGSSQETNWAQARKLADLIAYQEGSVVSRTVINQKTGTITLFAFSVGQGLSEHTAPYDAFLYIVDGVADVTIAGETQRMGEGEMVILPAGKPHALEAVEPFKMVLVMIRTGEKEQDS